MFNAGNDPCGCSFSTEMAEIVRQVIGVFGSGARHAAFDVNQLAPRHQRLKRTNPKRPRRIRAPSTEKRNGYQEEDPAPPCAPQQGPYSCAASFMAARARRDVIWRRSRRQCVGVLEPSGTLNDERAAKGKPSLYHVPPYRRDAACADHSPCAL